MARQRFIKPEFFQHEELHRAEVVSALPLRVAYAGLWTQCDRRGLFEWKPARLKLNVLPFDDVDFSKVLDALETAGFVESYVVDGKRFGRIPSFQVHQSFHVNEKPDRHIPSPPDRGGAAPPQHRAEAVPAPAEHSACTPVTVITTGITTTTTTVAAAGAVRAIPPAPPATAPESPQVEPVTVHPVEATHVGALALVADEKLHPHPLVSAFLHLVPPSRRRTWAALVAGWEVGQGYPGNRPASVEDIGQGLAEYLAAHADPDRPPDFSPRHVVRFVQKAEERRTQKPKPVDADTGRALTYLEQVARGLVA